MKMKRNTVFNLKSAFTNFSFSAFCILASSFWLWQFWLSFNQALTKLNEKPIATITFKYKTAQRKFLDRVIWDRLVQDSPVYNGDIIRTAPLSEATIWFSDGNVMELHENTMAQVFLNETGAETELSNGSISVDSSSSIDGLKLNSNGNIVTIDKGTKLTAEQSDDLKVLVQEGNAILSNINSNIAQNIQSGSSFVVNQTGQVELIPTVQLVSPSSNEKILRYTESESDVFFSWQTTNITDDMLVLLEVAKDKNFSDVKFSKTYSDKNNVNIALKSGTYFYRTRIVNKNSSKSGTIEKQNVSEGKIQILYSARPELLVPAKNYRYTYRTQKPAVRFLWSENQWATSWQLEIADNEKIENPKIVQRVSSPSSIITDLAEGKWYWRVTPFYSVNKVGLQNPSQVQSFEIEKTQQLAKPRLLLPQQNSTIDSTASSGTNFSWKNEAEAVLYTVKISKNQNLVTPVFEKNTQNNFVIVQPKVDGISDGVYYWGVTQTDIEGNVSETSAIRSVIISEGKLFQRTVFPPNDYQIAEGRIEDISFTWKTNLPFASRFQVSRDSNFKDLVIDESVNLTTFSGQKLAVGSWYWRVKADTNEIDFKTSPKKFTVLPPLDKPIPISPVASGNVVIRPNIPFVFKWNKVREADYYKLSIYNVSKNDELVYEKNLIFDTSCEIDMENTSDGYYRWAIQAYSQETELSTRRNGFVGDYNFNLKHIHPVKLLSPTKNQKIDGVQAIKAPGVARWSSAESSARTTFYLSKNKNPLINPIMKIENPKRDVQLIRLQEGTYYWTVQSITYDDFDISADNPERFTVTPIAPLENVKNRTPLNKKVFDSEYFRKSTKIVFSWDKVKDAEKYQITILDSKGKIRLQKVTDKLSYIVEDLSILDRGTFTWTVQAQNFFEGTLFRKSKEEKFQFIIDLPAPKKQKINMNGVLYGK